MTYRITFLPSARRQLARLARPAQRRVAQTIDALAQDPHPPGARPLQGTKAILRIRLGGLRIIYRVQDDILEVLVVRIARRDRAYRQLQELLRRIE